MIHDFRDSGLPFSWVSMDCHYGEQPWLLKKLNDDGICYMAEIPADTRIFLLRPETEIPKRKGNRGRHRGRFRSDNTATDKRKTSRRST
ncbi:MAG: transposase [Deltaproteobacteria bacterium]|nr:transposase [Deltaproteobacteria bacterium]